MNASKAGGGIRPDGSWRNWAGNQRSYPVRVERPTTEAEVVASSLTTQIDLEAAVLGEY